MHKKTRLLLTLQLLLVARWRLASAAAAARGLHWEGRCMAAAAPGTNFYPNPSCPSTKTDPAGTGMVRHQASLTRCRNAGIFLDRSATSSSDFVTHRCNKMPFFFFEKELLSTVVPTEIYEGISNFLYGCSRKYFTFRTVHVRVPSIPQLLVCSL